MRTCKRCGGPLGRRDERCPRCGEPVPRRKGAIAAVIIVSVVVILACAGIIAWRLGAFDALLGGTGGANAAGGGQEAQPAGDDTGDGGQDDPFVLLQPGFATEKITTEESARSVIAGVADKLGITDVTTELVDCREGEANDNRYWRFSQSYEGIPVYGRGVTVGADEEGGALLLSSNFERLEGVPTEPTVSADDAVAAASSALGVTGGVPAGLAVYSLAGVEPCLTWQVIAYADGEPLQMAFVSADTGELVSVEPIELAGAAWGTGTDKLTGDEVSFNAWHDDDGKYRLFDDERNIDVYNADGGTLMYDLYVTDEGGNVYYTNSYNGKWYRENGEEVKVEDVPDVSFTRYELDVKNIFKNLTSIRSDTSEFTQSGAVAAYIRLQGTYDFYESILGRNGYDDRDGSVDLVVNDYKKGDTTNCYSVAWPYDESTRTIISLGKDFSGDIDIIAHEYTHSTEAKISGMSGIGEAGALKEATSDIMGELVQDYFDGGLGGPVDWVNVYRDIVTPEKKDNPSTYGGENWGDPTQDDKDHDYGYVHNNSTVISHAAYLMCTDSGLAGETLSSEEMARLVYGTFHALTSDSSFSQFRSCMELTARIMQQQGLLSAENVERVRAAFDDVNVSAADNNDFMGNEQQQEQTERQVERAVTAVQGKRDVALVLDVSGSMDGEPIEQVRNAATGFVSRSISPDLRVGLVAYDSSAATLSPLSSNMGSLSYSISQLQSGGGTNMDEGMQSAAQLLSSDDDRKKIMVLMSDGLPNEGREGDELVSYASELREQGIKIYALCFVDDASGRSLLERMADPGCYYYIDDASDLEGFFTDIANEINGTRYVYAEAACPVDVTVTYNGETLSSAADSYNDRTSFGTLVVQDSDEGDGTTTKTLRLQEGPAYDIQITGTGDGTMDYRVGYMDDAGDYTDYRTFSGVRVTSATRATTSATRSDETVLDVDENGDGVIDVAYRAASGGEGARTDSSGVVTAVTAGCVALAAGGVALRVRSVMRVWKRAA